MKIEYVEIIKTEGCFLKGEILKKEYKFDDPEKWRFVWPDNSGQIYHDLYKDYFIPATLEAYNKYWNNPTDPKFENLDYLIPFLTSNNIT